jgi:hypothetical protein
VKRRLIIASAVVAAPIVGYAVGGLAFILFLAHLTRKHELDWQYELDEISDALFVPPSWLNDDDPE